MSRGYKRRQKGLKRGTWESPWDRSVRVMGEFYDNVTKELIRLESMTPEQREEIRKHFEQEKGTP